MPDEQKKRNEILIGLAKDGDQQAFIELTSFCMEKVARISLYIVGKKAIAEEITQEAFLRAYQKIHTLKNEIPFDNWVGRIAKNLAFDYLRRHRRILPLTVEIGWGDPNDRAIVLDVRRELMKIPVKFRLPLVLEYYEGMGMDEIAKMIKIPVGTVKSRIHAAKKKMKKALEENLEENKK